MPRYLVAPLGQRARIRQALLQQLAHALGRDVVDEVIPGEPPGRGDTTKAVPERVSRDGTFVAFELDDANGSALVIKHPRTGADVLRVDSLAGSRVGAVMVPSAVERTTEVFPDVPSRGGVP